MKIKTVLNYFIFNLVLILNLKESSAQNLLCTNQTLTLNFVNDTICINHHRKEQQIIDEKSDNSSITNSIAGNEKYYFGIPPIPIDPVIPGVKADDDFETWVPPLGLQVQNPPRWFLSGFDFENHPVWIYAYKRFSAISYFREIIRQNLTSSVTKNYRRLLYLQTKSVLIKSTPEKPVSQFVCIVDYENFDPDALTSPKHVLKALRHKRKSYNYRRKYAYRLIVINVNFISEVWINLIRPLLGRFIGRVEVYGRDRSLWMKQLLKRIPRDQLPEKYGGVRGHVPILIA